MDGQVKQASRRRVMVMCSPAMLAAWCAEGSVGWRCVKGLPKGFRVIGAGYSLERDLFGVVVEHESFAEVPVGTPIPEFVPEFQHG
jgi:hypothetical protein